MKENLIETFVDSSRIASMRTLISTEDDSEASKCAVELADVFNAGKAFSEIAADKDGAQTKLVSSFHNNLLLLIQKTWVEKSDEVLKTQVLYELEEFCKQLEAGNFSDSYGLFLTIVDHVVYLMFGSQSKTKDFDEYTLRIDPEFGIFWWYISLLPKDAAWSQNKCRIAVLLGMYFLANY